MIASTNNLNAKMARQEPKQIAAPKAQNKIAQGNALGCGSSNIVKP